MNSLEPVLWNSFMYSARGLYMLLFLYSQRLPMTSRTHCMPGRTRPTPFLAFSSRKYAASLSKWLGSIHPKRDVPPMEHMTMRFFISTLPIFQGVNRALYFWSMQYILS